MIYVGIRGLVRAKYSKQCRLVFCFLCSAFADCPRAANGDDRNGLLQPNPRRPKRQRPSAVHWIDIINPMDR